MPYNITQPPGNKKQSIKIQNKPKLTDLKRPIFSDSYPAGEDPRFVQQIMTAFHGKSTTMHGTCHHENFLMLSDDSK